MKTLAIVLAVFSFMLLPSVSVAQTLSATLTGAAEVPGPGDPDGSGTAEITLNVGLGTVCWNLTYTDIAPLVTGAHIHIAPPTEAGPVVVPLSVDPTGNSSSGCADVDRALVKALFHNAADYYVNVHNAEYPAGAIRGQLSRGKL